MIRKLLIGTVVLALAGCGGARNSTPGPPPPKQSVEQVTAKKKAIVATLRRAAEAQGPRNVPGLRSGCQSGTAPAFSPNGEQIAFGGGATICIAGRDGSDIHALPHVSVDTVFQLAWVSPTELLVDDDYAITTIGHGGKRQAYFPRPVDAPSFSVAGNGKRFATGTASDCPGCVGQGHVWTMAGKLVGTIGNAKDYYDSPSLSPNGLEVAYEQRGGIWVANADGTGARRIASDGTAPLWSPISDDEIAYTNSRGLWVVAPSGGSPRLVARGAGDNEGWSPNGKFIAYWGFGGVKVVTVGNGKVRSYRLVGFPDYRAPAWSPDSRDLLVTARLTPHCTALWSEPLDGQKPVLLSSCF